MGDRESETMAKSKRENLKQSLLFIFMGVCLVLIVLVWVDGLIEDTGSPANPAYVRPTAAFEVDESLYEAWSTPDDDETPPE